MTILRQLPEHYYRHEAKPLRVSWRLLIACSDGEPAKGTLLNRHDRAKRADASSPAAWLRLGDSAIARVANR